MRAKRGALTAAEFEAAYCERSGISIDKLHELGLFGHPCDCLWEHCEGWQITSRERLEEERRFVEAMLPT